jgi:predicted  nucleic acid-binding Zn-ribbon protein
MKLLNILQALDEKLASYKEQAKANRSFFNQMADQIDQLKQENEMLRNDLKELSNQYQKEWLKEKQKD